jgi:hypothetical protein
MQSSTGRFLLVVVTVDLPRQHPGYHESHGSHFSAESCGCRIPSMHMPFFFPREETRCHFSMSMTLIESCASLGTFRLTFTSDL